MYYNLTKGSITKGLILFALPMMAGNLLQQFYNIADTLIVGQALGKNALAAVGSAYALMTFLTSVFLQVPNELYDSMREYLVIIFAGLAAAATIIAQYFSGIGINICTP